MKPLFFLLSVILFLPGTLRPQIVVDQNDMPDAGDTLRVSITTTVLTDYSKTGWDTTWNFSMLEAMNQRVDTFVQASATPPQYWIYFPPGSVFNLASPMGDNEFIPGFPVSNSYRFFKNSGNAFVDHGFAFTIQGVPMAARYDSPDIYYTFPMNPTSLWNSTSSAAIDFTGFFYFATQRIRSSFVDGWGTVITPYGSFESLRVRCDLVQHDSMYISSMGFGLGIDRNITEYKWLAKNMGIPVLQVNSEGLLTTAIYRDIPRLPSLPLSVSLGPDTTVNKGATVTLHAEVSGGTPPYRIIWSTFDTTGDLTVTLDSTTTIGVVVIDGLNIFDSDQKLITVVSPGIEEKKAQRLAIFPNPVIEMAHIATPAGFFSGTLVFNDRRGQEVLRKEVHLLSGPIVIDLATLPSGLYGVRLFTDRELWTGKFVKL